MIFWGLMLLAVVAAAVVYWRNDFEPWLISIGTLLLSACGAVIVWFIIALNAPYNHELLSDETYNLKALGTDSAIYGRAFFIGGGYIGEDRVLNYITVRDGGAIKVEKAKADDSTIYEDAQNATVTVRHYDHTNWWIQTWPIGDHYEYEFHIPAGSVLESYTIDNK